MRLCSFGAHDKTAICTAVGLYSIDTCIANDGIRMFLNARSRYI